MNLDAEPVNMLNHDVTSLPATLECDDPLSQNELTADVLLAQLRARTDPRGYAAIPPKEIMLSDLRYMRHSGNVRAALSLLKEKRYITIDAEHQRPGAHKDGYWTIPEVGLCN